MMRLLLTVATSLLLLLTLFFFFLAWRQRSRRVGRVIILNGPSGSGKSSIQQEFQQLMLPRLWLKAGIDTLFDRLMPDITPANMPFWQAENPIRWVERSHDHEGAPIVPLLTGPQGEKVAYGMNSAIAAYAQAGCDLIVDYIAYKQAWVDDLQKKLRGIPTQWVRVDIPLAVLEARESARGTSPRGHGRSHYHFVYSDLPYDLVVDSAKESAKEIARKIAQALLDPGAGSGP